MAFFRVLFFHLSFSLIMQVTSAVYSVLWPSMTTVLLNLTPYQLTMTRTIYLRPFKTSRIFKTELFFTQLTHMIQTYLYFSSQNRDFEVSSSLLTFDHYRLCPNHGFNLFTSEISSNSALYLMLPLPLYLGILYQSYPRNILSVTRKILSCYTVFFWLVVFLTFRFLIWSMARV